MALRERVRTLAAAGAGGAICWAIGCSGTTSQDPPGLLELCDGFCSRYLAEQCGELGDMVSAVDFVAQPSCNAEGCEQFVRGFGPEYRAYYRCILAGRLECEVGGPPSIVGCDDIAVSTAETMGECERIPSLLRGDCPSDAADQYYCSTHVDFAKGYLPPESPGCNQISTGYYCCEPGWDVLPPK